MAVHVKEKYEDKKLKMTSENWQGLFTALETRILIVGS